ncbi:hypothetical protein ACROYT_G005274 [Oculina patagonica]
MKLASFGIKFSQKRSTALLEPTFKEEEEEQLNIAAKLSLVPEPCCNASKSTNETNSKEGTNILLSQSKVFPEAPCRVRKQQVQYVDHIIAAAELKPDPEKVRAMGDMPAPERKEDVRRFLGSIQYLAKFLHMLAEVETPLRELTRKDVLFHWDKPQATAFQKLKDMYYEAPVLAYNDVSKDVTVQCDASKSAVGAVLLQEGRPIAYAPRKLRESELSWAPIEKEMLVIVFSSQKFREYILGKTTLVQTDHKFLETTLQ